MMVWNVVGLCKQCATSGHSRPGSELEVVFSGGNR